MAFVWFKTALAVLKARAEAAKMGLYLFATQRILALMLG